MWKLQEVFLSVERIPITEISLDQLLDPSEGIKGTIHPPKWAGPNQHGSGELGFLADSLLFLLSLLANDLYSDMNIFLQDFTPMPFVLWKHSSQNKYAKSMGTRNLGDKKHYKVSFAPVPDLISEAQTSSTLPTAPYRSLTPQNRSPQSVLKTRMV
jgi:hypothetical protein